MPGGVVPGAAAVRRQALSDSVARRSGNGVGQVNQAHQSSCPRTNSVLLAALGPKNVELAAEIAEGWQPIFFLPEKAEQVWGQPLVIGDDVDGRREWVKPHLSLYIGGMGAKEKDFDHTLAVKNGYGAEADRIQELYLAGEKELATKAAPDALVRAVSLIGSAGFVKERVAASREAGVTVLNVVPSAVTAAERVKLVEELRALCRLRASPRPEDWPSMPCEYVGFTLKPVGFFDRNPSLDVPPHHPECPVIDDRLVPAPRQRTGVRGAFPDNTAATLSTARMPMVSRVASPALAVWGVSTRPGVSNSAGLTAGSPSKTSSAAPRIWRP
ncbi:hypothetical protein B1790_13210 [Mycobacterium sp. AT1]|nr:hypothetical protein B1790_13210 [Mycobacterium sp. AT1]